MKKFAVMGSILGAIGVLLGAFGAHGLKGVLSEYHYAAYRVGVEYLFFHLLPLFYISKMASSRLSTAVGYLFVLGILFFTGSNVLMTTEAVHHIDFHFLWPITPIGGILMVLSWIGLGYLSLQSEK